MPKYYLKAARQLAKTTISRLKYNRVTNFVLAKASHRFGKKTGLLIIDDIFPQPLSSFRLEEFSTYLRHWPNALVYSTGGAFPLLHEQRRLEKVVAEFEQNNPDLRGRVLKFSRVRTLNPRLAYLVFIGNTFAMLPFLESRNIPFIFTLYPGGGFALHNEQSDAKLRRVFASPLFRQVLVSQSITQDYLLDNNFCDAAQITLVYGVVMPISKLTIGEKYPHQYFPTAKETFDICFVAHKYMPRGVDKGYDVFIETAHQLASRLPQVRFHVVGNFTPDDIDTSALKYITFYGTRKTDFFPAFYAGMDLILSPNVSFRLQPGAFDGFPTGSCVEAGLCGVALMCTDELGQNTHLHDGENILIITNEVEKIVNKIVYLYNHPTELHAIAKTGQLRLREIFSAQSQMQPRINMLQRFLEAGNSNTAASLTD